MSEKSYEEGLNTPDRKLKEDIKAAMDLARVTETQTTDDNVPVQQHTHTEGASEPVQPPQAYQPYMPSQDPHVGEAPQTFQPPIVSQNPYVGQAPQVNQVPRMQQAPQVKQAPPVGQTPMVNQTSQINQTSQSTRTWQRNIAPAHSRHQPAQQFPYTNWSSATHQTASSTQQYPGGRYRQQTGANPGFGNTYDPNYGNFNPAYGQHDYPGFVPAAPYMGRWPVVPAASQTFIDPATTWPAQTTRAHYRFPPWDNTFPGVPDQFTGVGQYPPGYAGFGMLRATAVPAFPSAAALAPGHMPGAATTAAAAPTNPPAATATATRRPRRGDPNLTPPGPGQAGDPPVPPAPGPKRKRDDGDDGGEAARGARRRAPDTAAGDAPVVEEQDAEGETDDEALPRPEAAVKSVEEDA